MVINIFFIFLFVLEVFPDDVLPVFVDGVVFSFGFSFPDEVGFNNKGLYKFSRNPMYVAYFICFIGMALLTQSWILLGVVMLFQISAHWIILAEERWCILKFEKAYREYMKRVRRYI